MLLILLSIILILLTFSLKMKMTYWKRRGVPHEKPHFFYGNLKTWKSQEQISEIFDRFYKKFKGSGPYVGFYFLQRPAALLLDLDLVKDVLVKDFRNFYDRGIYHNQKDDPLTGHLFRLGGPKWKPLRKTLSPTFTSGKMKQLFPLVLHLAEDFTNILQEKLKESSSGDGVAIWEISFLMGSFTADVIGTCAFGLECNAMRCSDTEFVTVGKKSFYMRRHHRFIDFFIESYPDMARRLHLKQVHPEINSFYFRIVEETVKYRLESGVRKNDFMDMLIEMLQSKEMTMDEVVAQSFIFFVAGFDTSSSTMAFALYELALNPQIQERLRLEVNEVFEKHNQTLTYEALKDMHYLEQVIAETLRKYPVLPHITRLAENFYPLSRDAKFNIEKGTLILIPIKSIHYDPDYYPEPEVFLPERFAPEELLKRPACSWLPFGEGPRNCIGLRFGKMQACIGLAHLLRDFQFKVCDRTEAPIKLQAANALLAPENGIYLQVEKVKE